MVIITGASAGIGEETAYLLGEKNFDLILIARRLDRLKLIKQKIEKSSTSKVFIFKCDISKITEIEKLFQKNSKVFSQASILINNAGLAMGTDTADEINLDELLKMMNTNVTGLMAFTRLALKFLLGQKKSHIVNLGSVAGRIPYKGGSIYCASKAAIKSFSQNLRIDLAGKNVRVTEIAPGMVETEFSVVRLKNKKLADKVYEGMKPLTAGDIARSILWCLEQPEHVNIQELVIYPTDQASVGIVNRK